MGFIIRNSEGKVRAKQLIDELDDDKAWDLTIKRHVRKRSTRANSYYWVAVIGTIAMETGHDGHELHEYLCGERYGWIEKEYPTRTIQRPAQGTSGMTTEAFAAHIEWAKAWAARHLGIIIPESNEVIT